MSWNVYLSGEIHTDWRERIQEGANREKLDITFTTPVTHHEASDDVGEAILGKEDSSFWRDHKAAKINAIRIQKAIEDAEVGLSSDTLCSTMLLSFYEVSLAK